MTTRKGKASPAGELRQSQVVTTFGPGAMIDLPYDSIIVGGLDHWYGGKRRIYEERLEARVAEIMGLDKVTLYEPPVDSPDPNAPTTGIAAFVFPTWFLAQTDDVYKTEAGIEYRTRPLIPWDRLVKGGYLSPERKNIKVVPVRFVQACIHGHISDIDWYAFVREEPRPQRVGQLWLDEGGAGNDFSEIYVRCEMTKKRRPLSDVTVPGSHVLGTCYGRMPWLGPMAREECKEQNRLLTRSASNAYFSQTMSAIAIPDTDAALRDAVNLVYDDFLQYAESAADVAKERKKQKVHAALEGLTDEAVWKHVQTRKAGQPPAKKSIKRLEIETLLSQPTSVGEGLPDGDFYARTRSLDGLTPDLRGRIDRIVLVHRLREVIAQIGFTRFEASTPDIDGELSLDVKSAPLARELTWVPAAENKGEGVFIAFSDAAIQEWLQRDAVKKRGKLLEAGFDSWAGRKGHQGAVFPGLPYIMLHSLSHLLLTAVALECGYSASSIRERVYTGSSGHGILLYTGSSGSEGTLGGLVGVGRDIEHHLERALDLGRLCSNDPVCAQHNPENPLEERFLQGAACHGCLLIAETSCERRNDFLDRALVVPTVSDRGAAFFGGEEAP